jgi:DNA/RNA endonuclease YhcR with UshA esterase domain
MASIHERLTVVATLAFALISVLPAQESPKRVPAREARSLIGTHAVVFGTVAEIHKTDAITRLNFDQPFPKQSFTAVVFPQNFNLFTNLTELKGRTVEVSGIIANYRGQAQIVLTRKEQVKVAEPAKSDAEKK